MFIPTKRAVLAVPLHIRYDVPVQLSRLSSRCRRPCTVVTENLRRTIDGLHNDTDLHCILVGVRVHRADLSYANKCRALSRPHSIAQIIITYRLEIIMHWKL